MNQSGFCKSYDPRKRSRRRLIMAESTHASATCQVGCCYYARRFGELENLATFWLSSPISPWHKFARRSRLEYHRRRSIHHRPVRVGRGCVNYVPSTLLPITDLPLLRSRWAVRNSLKFTFPSLCGWLSRHGARDVDVLMISHPHLASLRSIVHCNRLIYRMTDSCAAFPRAPMSLVDAEADLFAQADAVVCTSHVLAETLPEDVRLKTTVIPNGADVRALTRPAVEPQFIRHIARPRAVYVGAIDAWFDVAWVRTAACALPQVQFVLAGPVHTDLRPLAKCSNVHIVGPIHWPLIAGLLQHADVGIVPFKNTPLVQTISPIKIYEYLSVGLPVVSRSWQELRRIKLPIKLASSSKEFVEGIAEAIENKHRCATAPEPWDYSWDTRFTQLRSVCGL